LTPRRATDRAHRSGRRHQPGQPCRQARGARPAGTV